MALATTVIVVLLSFIGMLNAMLMSVMERTREFGVLRAIGWKSWRVMKLVLSESVVITSIAAVLGILLSCLTILILRQWPATSLLVPQNISLFAAGLATMAAFTAAVAGSCYPSFHAARVTPIESLRHE
jgi:putative ABC transport system permease protein